jgi:hypothetical protein
MHFLNAQRQKGSYHELQWIRPVSYHRVMQERRILGRAWHGIGIAVNSSR